MALTVEPINSAGAMPDANRFAEQALVSREVADEAHPRVTWLAPTEATAR